MAIKNVTSFKNKENTRGQYENLEKHRTGLKRHMIRNYAL